MVVFLTQRICIRNSFMKMREKINISREHQQLLLIFFFFLPNTNFKPKQIQLYAQILLWDTYESYPLTALGQ